MTAADYTREELEAKLHEYASLHDAMESEIIRLRIQNKNMREKLASELERQHRMHDDYTRLWTENLELKTELHRLQEGDTPIILQTGSPAEARKPIF